MKINWNTEEEPTDNGYYLVEAVGLARLCVSDRTQLLVDEYKNGQWIICGEWVDRWAKIEGWIDAKVKPPINMGVLVYIPKEDGHITSGMWDVSEKWVLLDEYREPECEVTHWTLLPDAPDNDN